MTGDEVRDLTSKSSSEYRTLFLWKGWGQGERREHQWPRLHLRPLCLNLCVDLSAPLFGNKRRTNTHWLPNMIQIFLQTSRKKANNSVHFNVMRLVKWNNPELEWNNNFLAHILSNTINYNPSIDHPLCYFWENFMETVQLKELQKTLREMVFHPCILFGPYCFALKCHSCSEWHTSCQFNSCRHFQLIWPRHCITFHLWLSIWFSLSARFAFGSKGAALHS